MSLNNHLIQQRIGVSATSLKQLTDNTLLCSGLQVDNIARKEHLKPMSHSSQGVKSNDLRDALQVNGGAIKSRSVSITSHERAKESNMREKLQNLPPVSQSAMFMVTAMSLHFFGYEFARSSTLALFTSSRMGFTSLSALPLAMSFVSPSSFILLWWYGKQLEEFGPRVALRVTNLLCVTMLFVSACFTQGIQYFSLDESYPLISKVVVWISFVFQNSYAHLLYTQHWSFIGSILNQKQGAKWFASIAGASSVSSTIGASGASRLTNVLGLSGLMIITVMSLLISTFFAEGAYFISEKHGFQPAKETSKEIEKSEQQTSSKKKNTIQKGIDLFKRVPILGALFCEVLSFQSLSMLLNVCFVRMLKLSITDDKLRAAWTANFYALINGASGMLQFFVLPFIMQRIDPRWIWRIMPLISLCFTSFQCAQKNPSLFLASSAFFLAKMMDYSFRGVANEMVYVPLEFESRYLGKEIIGVFANRFGKSGISIFLSVLTSIFGDLNVMHLSYLTTIASASWFTFALKVSNLLATPTASSTNNRDEDTETNKVDNKKMK